MKTHEPELVRIRVEWHGFNYGRGEDDPVFVKEDECIEFARVTPRRLIIHYGDGRVPKQLHRFTRFDDRPLSKWCLFYGSHDRLSRTQIKFFLLPSIESKESIR